ncbi:MAG: hypothetical protein KTR24_15245 [Saprospiraceae bacterium]|nr:hypothetical protein [Saprospiraceae bacterium]
MDPSSPLRSNRHLIVALFLGVIIHGASMFFTLEQTYDALVHLFFAEHYASNWFEPWNEKWYTGFSVMSYPPLVHQLIALCSLGLGLKSAMYLVAFLIIILFVSGVFRFSQLVLRHDITSGYAALIAVLSSSFAEALHVFGQLPTLFGIALLLHALPHVYFWIKDARRTQLLVACSILAITVCSHHVTPIFGMVFFIFPVIGLALYDLAKADSSDLEVKFPAFFKAFRSAFIRIVSFGAISLSLIIGCILPYWINTKNNPITQIPIPHGSRDSFIEVFSSGLVFFLIPWGFLLLILPYIFIRYFSKRLLFFGLSFSLLFILGTGGTTPIPKMILGETAFNILTLDRFTFWASIMAIPIAGEFAYRVLEGDLGEQLRKQIRPAYHRISSGVLGILLLAICGFTITLGKFRPLQPQKIEMLPITNFLNQDQHDEWRYLTLGFGDQMAWLGAQSSAWSVDGNYHSARRLPELTSRAVERLENSKFRGIEGLGSLQQFLTVPEKYNLKYIFSQDKFYAPLLYFSGWQRVGRLENGVMVWERLGVPPIPTISHHDHIPRWQKMIWGIIPMTILLLGMLIAVVFRARNKGMPPFAPIASMRGYTLRLLHLWPYFVVGIWLLIGFRQANQSSRHASPEKVVLAYFDDLDFKRFENAHQLLDPAAEVSLDQFMLNVSISDGLLSSYAKLDSLSVHINEQNEQSAQLSAHATYITPLKKVHQKSVWWTTMKGGKWYLMPSEKRDDLPPRRTVIQGGSDYHLQGRRRSIAELTDPNDILSQPEIALVSSSLVLRDGRYSIIGRLRNTDHLPADVAVRATLYDEQGEVIARFNAKDILKHRLLPLEASGFRIDFEETAWLDPNSAAPTTFDPDEFNPMGISSPSRFSLEIQSNVTGSDLDRSLSIARTGQTSQDLEITLFNSGTEEITVPQMLINYYDRDGVLDWVEAHYGNEAIRQQRKVNVKVPLEDLQGISHVAEVAAWTCNGRQEAIPEHVFTSNEASLLQSTDDATRILIDLNSFIASPQ